MTSSRQKILAISGGVGGAKLALGLANTLSPEALTIVCNTGDDFQHLGFTICPDLDTVLYTLADWNNKELGWGQEGESWQFLEALKRLDGEDWFRLGDRDLATHVVRSGLLQEGRTLSEVISHLCSKMDIRHTVVPMSNDPVPTRVHVDSGETLAFQHYFVRDRCEPVVTGFEFTGIAEARPSPGFDAAIADADAVVVCPSNPFVSVDPIFAIPGVVDRLRARQIPVLVVSNIVGGQALKGPAAKMMRELGMPQTAQAVAEHYATRYEGLFSGFVLDEQDREQQAAIEALGLATIVTNTVMLTLHDKTQLAESVLALAHKLRNLT